MARSKSLAALRDEGSRETTIGMLNTHLRHAHGDPRRMPKNLQRRQQDIDLTIRVAERANTREHTVYVAADLTGMPGKTPRQKIAKARKMIQRAEDAYAVQGYMVGSLDMGEVVSKDNDSEVIMEIKTAAGVYLGGSDSKGSDATHLISRNRYLLPVSVQENVPYRRADGTTATRTVIQMQDVTPDVWASTTDTITT